MSTRSRGLLLAGVVLFIASVSEFSRAQESSQPNTAERPLTIAEYTAELDRLIAATSRLVNSQDAAGLIRGIAPVWHVQEGVHVYDVSSEWLRSDLGDWQKKPSSKILERVVFHLQALRDEAASSDAQPNDVTLQRARLNHILAAKEFEDVVQTTWWDRLKQRIGDWLWKLTLRFVASSAIPTVKNIFIYGLIFIAVVALSYWMYKTIRDNSRLETVLPGTLPVSSKEWSLWMAEARAAANAGKWRDAIHLAYWCGISYLEAQDMWPPDRARTPREYLRLLPSSSQYYPVLRGLTRSFEVVWYGTQPADGQAFSETVAQLEKLGCRYN